jgi:hypothetical protein
MTSEQRGFAEQNRKAGAVIIPLFFRYDTVSNWWLSKSKFKVFICLNP